MQALLQARRNAPARSRAESTKMGLLAPDALMPALLAITPYRPEFRDRLVDMCAGELGATEHVDDIHGLARGDLSNA